MWLERADHLLEILDAHFIDPLPQIVQFHLVSNLMGHEA